MKLLGPLNSVIPSKAPVEYRQYQCIFYVLLGITWPFRYLEFLASTREWIERGRVSNTASTCWSRRS